MIPHGLPQKAPEPIAQQSGPQQSLQGMQMPPAQMMQAIPAQPQGPQGGPDKWAMDGIHNLKQHVDDSDRVWLDENRDTLMLDPKAKHLLVTSSSFQPGSKPLDDIVKHLKARLDKITKR